MLGLVVRTISCIESASIVALYLIALMSLTFWNSFPSFCSASKMAEKRKDTKDITTSSSVVWHATLFDGRRSLGWWHFARVPFLVTSKKLIRGVTSVFSSCSGIVRLVGQNFGAPRWPVTYRTTYVRVGERTSRSSKIPHIHQEQRNSLFHQNTCLFEISIRIVVLLGYTWYLDS